MARYLVGVSVLALFACGEAESTPVAEDMLVLELGGDHEPLDVALRRAGAGSPSAPAPTAIAEPTEPISDVRPREAAAPAPQAEPLPVPAPTPRAEPTPTPAARTVELQEGQTIYALAGEYLGASRRWREILELNGWTEEQAMRLRAGTRVKLPAR